MGNIKACLRLNVVGEEQDSKETRQMLVPVYALRNILDNILPELQIILRPIFKGFQRLELRPEQGNIQ